MLNCILGVMLFLSIFLSLSATQVIYAQIARDCSHRERCRDVGLADGDWEILCRRSSCRNPHAIPSTPYSYQQRFQRGRLARIQIDGIDETDLDLFVYDPNGNLVGSDIGLTDEATVEFMPAQSGIYVIRVSNLGTEENPFWMEIRQRRRRNSR
jgi:hypothetical protein